MRLHSALILGLSFVSALAAAEPPAPTTSNAVVVDKRDFASGLLVHARDAVLGAVHKIQERALEGRASSKKKPKKTGTKKKPKKTGTKKTSKKTGTTKSAKKTKSKPAPTASKTKHATTPSTTKHAIIPSTTKHATTLSKSKTTASKSAAPSSTIKARVRCGQKGSTCSGNSCSLPRSIDFRQTLNRRAYGNADGQLRNLINRKGNVKLSDPAKRDEWIPFGADPASVTIGGLTGCTAVIAISEQGMYAFHIWEAGAGNTLDPAKYKATLNDVKTKLASRQKELAGGQLYVYLPTNPDQPGKLLYDSTHWTADLKEEESEPVPAGDKKWTKQVKRVDDIEAAVKEGSGLSITKQITYEAPKKGVKTSDWMTAQFDPAASDTEKQFGVWTSKQAQVAQTKWTAAQN